MNSEYIVTVAVSFYNDENTIESMINSVLNQSFKKWKLVMVDDGSIDSSLDIVNKYACKYENIVVYSDGENWGLQRRLNMLVDMCNTKYFARMDADDVMLPFRLEKQIRYLEDNIECDVVGANAYSILDDGKILGKRNASCVPKSLYGVFKNGIFIHPTVTGKSEWFKKFKYCESPYALRAEDYELWCRSYLESRFYVLQEPLIFYRENSSMKKSISNTINGLKSVLMIIRREAPKKIGFVNSFSIYIYILLHLIINILILKVGAQSILVNRRYLPLSKSEYEIADQIYRKAICIAG